MPGTPLRPRPFRRIRLAGRLALFGLTLYACGSERDLERGSDPANPAAGVDDPPVVLAPGALRGRFPPDPHDVAGEAILEGAFGLTIGGDAIYVLDQMAQSVLRLDLDARLVARMGGPGAGPGELTNPFSLSVGPDGDVWVGDPGGGRLTRYRPDGTTVDDHRMPYPVVNFAVLERGPVFPSLNASTLLGAADSQGGMVELPVAREIVPHRISRGPEDRVSPLVLRFARLRGGDVALLQNRHGTEFALWRVRISPDRDSIEHVTALPLPGWLHTMLGRETDRVRESAPADFATGDFLIPFKGMHADGGRLWLAPATSAEALVVSVPLQPGEPIRVVVADEDVYGGAIDAAVTGDRLVVLYSTEARVYDLESAPADRFRNPREER